MAVSKNEQTYLANLAKTGNKGQQAWANARAKELGVNSHQFHLDKTFDGGSSAYIKGQQDRYQSAVKGKDYGLADRLKADSQRIGYSLPSINPMQGYLDNINSMYDKQKESQLAQFKARRDQAVGQINQQKAELKPMYADKRNQADVVNAQNVSKLRELMAAQGLTSSGENVTSQVALGSARQGALNQLNTQEQQQVNDFDRRISDINNPAEEQSFVAQLEAERARALADAERYSDESSYGRYRDSIGDNRWREQFDYGKQRDTIADQRDDKRYAEEKAWREYQFKNMSASEKAQLEWAKSQFGEEMAWRMFETEYNGNLEKSMNDSQIDFYKNAGFNSGGGGGGYTKKASGSPNKTYQTHMNQAVQSGGVPAAWVPAMTELIGRESSWNHKADNPTSTAYGYGQFLDSTESNYEKKMGLNYDNPVHQLIMMTQYVKDRYGTPEKALAFWDKNKWY
jgi:hypothetical protein